MEAMQAMSNTEFDEPDVIEEDDDAAAADLEAVPEDAPSPAAAVRTPSAAALSTEVRKASVSSLLSTGGPPGNPESDFWGFGQPRAVVLRVMVVTLLLACGCAIVYTSSVLSEPITRECTDWPRSTPQLCVSVLVFMVIIVGPVTPLVQFRIGFTGIGMTAGATVVLGLGLTGLAVWTCSQPLYFIGFGVVTGIASALSYYTALRHVLMWLNKRAGLASSWLGFCVGALAVVFAQLESQVSKALHHDPNVHHPAASLFFILAGLSLVLLVPGVCMIRQPTVRELARRNSSLAMPRASSDITPLLRKHAERNRVPSSDGPNGDGTLNGNGYHAMGSSNGEASPVTPVRQPAADAAMRSPVGSAPSLKGQTPSARRFRLTRQRSGFGVPGVDTALPLQKLIKLPQLWLFYVVYGLALVPGWGLVSMMVQLLHSYGGGVHAAITGTTLILVVYALARASWGPIAERIGYRNCYFIIHGSQAVAFIIMIFAKNFYAAALLCCVGVTGYGGGKVLFGAYGLKLVGKANAKLALGILMSSYGLAGTLSPLATHGLITLAKHHGKTGADVFVYWNITMACVTALGGFLAMFLRK